MMLSRSPSRGSCPKNSSNSLVIDSTIYWGGAGLTEIAGPNLITSEIWTTSHRVGHLPFDLPFTYENLETAGRELIQFYLCGNGKAVQSDMYL